MSTPQPPDSGEPAPAERPGPDPAAEAPFDPYRFGLPDHPVPPEYAPPGYVFPTAPPAAPPTPPPAAPTPANPWAPPTGLPPTQAAPPPNQPPNQPFQQYPQYGPPPPMYHAYGQPKPGNGKAIAAMVLGILSLIFFWTTIFDLVLIIPAVVFGTLALGDAKVRNTGGRGQAMAGLVCAGLATIFAVLALVFLVHAANKCGGFNHSSDPGFNQCLRDNL